MKTFTAFLRGFFFCTIFLAASPVKAQWNTFEKVWHPYWFPYSVGLDIVATADGYTLLITTSDSTFVQPQGYALVHTDMDGVPQWSRYYCPVGNWGDGALKRTADGGYILSVSVYDTSGSYLDIALIKTDSLGNPEWSRCYGGDFDDHLGTVIQTFDGGYLLCTSSTDTIYQVNGQPLILTKTDNQGLVQWSYEYYDTLPTKPYWKDVTECGEGGGYLVLERGITLRIDATGSILWSKIFYSTAFRRVFWTGDGFAVAGNVGSGPPSLMRLDTAGTQLWHKNYPSNTNALNPNVSDVVRTGDGGYAFTGVGIDTNSLPYDRVTLLRTDSAGNMYWHKAYRAAYDGRSAGVDQDYTGSFVMAGGTNDSLNMNGMIYFLRTDSSGKTYCNEINIAMPTQSTLVPEVILPMLRVPRGHSMLFPITPFSLMIQDSIYCFTLGMDEESLASGLTVFPNPTGGNLTIRRSDVGPSASLVVIDVTGKTVLEKPGAFAKGQAETTITLDLAPGIYFIQLNTEDKTMTLKIIVE